MERKIHESPLNNEWACCFMSVWEWTVGVEKKEEVWCMTEVEEKLGWGSYCECGELRLSVGSWDWVGELRAVVNRILLSFLFLFFYLFITFYIFNYYFSGVWRNKRVQRVMWPIGPTIVWVWCEKVKELVW